MGRKVKNNWNFSSSNKFENPETYEEWREATAEICNICGGKIHLDELGCDTCGNMPEAAPYTEQEMKDLYDAFLYDKNNKGVAHDKTTSYDPNNNSSSPSKTSSSSSASKFSFTEIIILVLLLVFFFPAGLIYLIYLFAFKHK